LLWPTRSFCSGALPLPLHVLTLLCLAQEHRTAASMCMLLKRWQSHPEVTPITLSHHSKSRWLPPPVCLGTLTRLRLSPVPTAQRSPSAPGGQAGNCGRSHRDLDGQPGPCAPALCTWDLILLLLWRWCRGLVHGRLCGAETWVCLARPTHCLMLE